MDSFETTNLAPPSPTSPPTGAASTPMASCCSTATFPAGDVRSWLGNPRVLAVGGLAIGGAGLALGWNWLTAIGIAPLLISVAPCLIMCAFGMCMMGKASKAISNQSAPPADGPSVQLKPPSASES